MEYLFIYLFSEGRKGLKKKQKKKQKKKTHIWALHIQTAGREYKKGEQNLKPERN